VEGGGEWVKVGKLKRDIAKIVADIGKTGVDQCEGQP